MGTRLTDALSVKSAELEAILVTLAKIWEAASAGEAAGTGVANSR